jgi:mRNA interferase RelE/StbE
MYSVLIDELIFAEDFKVIDKNDQQQIIKTIRKKLTLAPTQYGKPLRENPKGLWKLKIGQYRVIYKIQKAKILVYVIKIGFRRDDEVYKEILKRLKNFT